MRRRAVGAAAVASSRAARFGAVWTRACEKRYATRSLVIGRSRRSVTTNADRKRTTGARRRSIGWTLVAAAALASGCSRDRDRHLPLPSPSAAPEARPSLAAASYADAGLGPRIAVLDAPGSSEDAKVAVLETLASDRGDGATSVLLRFVDDPSTLISAASIKGLAGRSCERVQPTLVGLLDDQEWQRRAWAAKVLGVNGCRSAQPALGARLQHERDGRVQARLEEAMELLAEVGQ